ncbi:MAG: glycogen-binding domain-containing protein [Gammaproteobacteria bacterium]|nr:glycogen-binding domain-containing protein [Gammaproteobacteria bacterium]
MSAIHGDKLWGRAGLILLAVLLTYSFYQAYVMHSASRNEYVEVMLEANINNAKDVRIAGSFNSWQPQCCLENIAGTDEWKIKLKLKPGVYEYVYVVDGKHWIPEPENTKLKDGFGGRNAVIYVNSNRQRQGDGNV